MKDAADVVGVVDVVDVVDVVPMQGPDMEPPVQSGRDALMASVRDVSYTELELAVVVAGGEPLKASVRDASTTPDALWTHGPDMAPPVQVGSDV